MLPLRPSEVTISGRSAGRWWLWRGRRYSLIVPAGTLRAVLQRDSQVKGRLAVEPDQANEQMEDTIGRLHIQRMSHVLAYPAHRRGAKHLTLVHHLDVRCA